MNHVNRYYDGGSITKYLTTRATSWHTTLTACTAVEPLTGCGSQL